MPSSQTGFFLPGRNEGRGKKKMPIKSVSKEIDDKAKKESAFHGTQTVTLIVTDSCNLRCKYCYEKHDKRSRKSLSFSQVKDILTRHLSAPNEFKKIVIDFFGGEPFLEFPLIKKTIEWLSSKEWGKEYFCSLSTNGTILDDDMKEFFLKYKEKISIGFSMDGSRTAHNIVRNNSYDLLEKNIPFFIDNWPDNPAKMTICAETIPYMADSIIDMEEKGIYFSANVVFEDIWGDEQKKVKLLKEYENQLELLLDYYKKNSHLCPVEPLFRPFPHHLKNKESRDDAIKEFTHKKFCGSGVEMIAYNVDGKAYPCHRFIPFISGKELTDDVQLKTDISWKTKKCENCDLLPVCPTCAGFNWEINNDPYLRTTFHCEALALEVIARCKYEAWKLSNTDADQVEKLSYKEQVKIKETLEILKYVNKNGFYVPKSTGEEV
jgi:radical SAM protein with 4Fe4S-binding SPASM domain